MTDAVRYQPPNVVIHLIACVKAGAVNTWHMQANGEDLICMQAGEDLIGTQAGADLICTQSGADLLGQSWPIAWLNLIHSPIKMCTVVKFY